ncbi:chondroitin sulfate N-acetylgalactosaminyltransferase 1-like [Trichomycterus rosablanca]|uniref:chondroitin sulfate N-acetylgalactosaminyltransferase 1-like n=1 Tax=Trichomycterus rosablanca TaxID=2290929 RepID=UPI002F3548A9
MIVMLKRWSLATVARWRILLMVTFCFTFLLYFRNCRTQRNQNHQVLFMDLADDSRYQALLQEHEEQYEQYTTSLTKQILQLKKALQEKRHLQTSQRQGAVKHPAEVEEIVQTSNHNELEMFLQEQLRLAEIHVGTNLPNEYALVPFESFTLQKVFQLETGLTRHPVRSALQNDLAGALEVALRILNGPKDQDDPRHHRIYSPQDFFEGISRTESDKGAQYDLAFRENSSLDFRRLVLFHPFAPLQKVKEEAVDTSSVLINIIVPLAERVDTFRQFMDNFRQICTEDKMIHLTVVYFGTEKLDEVRGIMDTIARRTRSRNFTLVHLNEKFSRGRALNVGARAWKKSNVLLFFCDVDVHFTAEFLNSCRMNAQPGKRVFYPIPFSQYNPGVIYGDHIPPIEKQLVINQSVGYWRDFGFGMTCQYWSDFINIGGFDMNLKPWEKEDLYLYRKYLHSNLMVVRAPSRGLFQMWHQTLCSEDLETKLFQVCMQSKAINEASYSYMGRLYFQQEIDNHIQKQTI